MKKGYAIVRRGGGVSYLTKHDDWSTNAGDAHVFATWAGAKWLARSHDYAEVVEAWL